MRPAVMFATLRRGSLIALLVLAGCRDRGREKVAPPVLNFQFGVAGLENATVRKHLNDALETRLPRWLPDFDWAHPVSEGPRWALELDLFLSESTRPIPTDAGILPEDQVFRGARLEMELRFMGAEPPKSGRRAWRAESAVAKNQPVFGGFEAVIAESVEAALRQIAIERELMEAKPERILAVLADPDPALRAKAVDVIRERGGAEFLNPLLERLADGDEDQTVVMKSIGALVALKDERAVPALIDSATRRSPVYLTQIIFGVAEIGGKEAEAYLFTVASGHADPQVRKNADDALRELARRKERSGSEEETR